jgi:hypothetical protein
VGLIRVASCTFIEQSRKEEEAAVSSSALIRWGGLAAMMGGIAYVINVSLGLLVSETTTSAVHLFADSFAVVPVLLTLVGMVGFHTLQKPNYGGIGRGGFYTVVVGFLAQLIGTITHLLSGSEALEWLVFPVGVGLMIVGLMIYGVATLQARMLPRWCGIAFIVVPPLGIMLEISSEGYGEILFGLLWLALGYVLWSGRGTPTEQQPSRVR